MAAHDGRDRGLAVGVGRRAPGRPRGRGVEEALAVDAQVEDVLHEAGRLVAEHPLVAGPSLACSSAVRTSLTASLVRSSTDAGKPTSSSSNGRPDRPLRPARQLAHPATAARARPSATPGAAPRPTRDDGARPYARRHDPRRRRGARRDAGPGAVSRYAALLHERSCRTLRSPRSSPLAPPRAEAPRWVWWSAEDAAAAARRCRVPSPGPGTSRGPPPAARGWSATAGQCWAAAHGIPSTAVPAPPTGDLFELAVGPRPRRPDALLDGDGHLRGDHEEWLGDPRHLEAWARAALETAPLQHDAAAATSVASSAPCTESAAAVLCLELRRDGLPLDRGAPRSSSPRWGPPGTEAEEREARRMRDARVLRHVPGPRVDRPAQPRPGARPAPRRGRRRPNTRKWVLEPYRTVHPVVDALLEWRRDERIATTYGYRWLDAHVGADDRLRGRWTACDGAAGRMTAENGLHNLPAGAAPGVAAHEGHVFVRADLGQIEPRVLAVVSGDAAFAAATRADDLYAPVAQRLGVERPVAKVAVLAAMYGQRSGARARRSRARAGVPRGDGAARPRLRRGRRGEPCAPTAVASSRPGRFLAPSPVGADPALDAARGASRATRSSREPRPSSSRRGQRPCGRRPGPRGRGRPVPARRAARARPAEHADEVAAGAWTTRRGAGRAPRDVRPVGAPSVTAFGGLTPDATVPDTCVMGGRPLAVRGGNQATTTTPATVPVGSPPGARSPGPPTRRRARTRIRRPPIGALVVRPIHHRRRPYRQGGPRTPRLAEDPYGEPSPWGR